MIIVLSFRDRDRGGARVCQRRGGRGMFQKDFESIFVSVSCRSSVPSG